jgi:hypothetical protein
MSRRQPLRKLHSVFFLQESCYVVDDNKYIEASGEKNEQRPQPGTPRARTIGRRSAVSDSVRSREARDVCSRMSVGWIRPWLEIEALVAEQKLFARLDSSLRKL